MKKRVVVVDDSATIRVQTCAILEGHFDYVTAENGKEGLKLIRKELPDAVIADLEMPEMDGLELLRALRDDEATKGIPVLVATTVTAVDKVNECRKLGCAGFVLKPVKKEYLLAKLNALVSGGR